MEEKGACEPVRLIIGGGEGEHTLQWYLQKQQKLSQKALKKLKHHGEVLVNGEPGLLKQVVKPGDLIELKYPPEKSNPYLIPQRVPLAVIYEDEDLVVLDKQAGICVHPTKGHPDVTLANGLLYHWQEREEKGAQVHFVNRLDKDTSGLVLVAKNYYCAQQFFQQQVEGLLKRSYLALVCGKILQDGVIDLPIAREEIFTIRRHVVAAGRRAVTHYRVKAHYRVCGTREEYSLVSVVLETGRTHQIRVHFSYLGYPLVGDTLYGGDSRLLTRQFLHADSLSFDHPRRREEMAFTSPLDGELKRVLACLDKQ